MPLMTVPVGRPRICSLPVWRRCGRRGRGGRGREGGARQAQGEGEGLQRFRGARLRNCLGKSDAKLFSGWWRTRVFSGH